MSVVINPIEGKFLRNWFAIGRQKGQVDLSVTWDDKDCAQASSVIKSESEKIGIKTDVSGICNLISAGDPMMFPFRAWIQAK